MRIVKTVKFVIQEHYEHTELHKVSIFKDPIFTLINYYTQGIGQFLTDISFYLQINI